MLFGIGMMVSFQHCTSDSETPDSNFTYNNESYKLGGGFIDYNQKSFTNGIFTHELWLFSSSIELKPGVGPVGTGQGLAFSFNSSSDTKIESGTYQLGAGYDKTFNINWGNVLMNLDFLDDKADADDFVSGSVTVKENNGSYEISFNLQTENDLTVTGYYKGTLYDGDDIIPKN